MQNLWVNFCSALNAYVLFSAYFSRMGQFDAFGYIRFLRKAPCCICDLNSNMRLRLYPLEYFPPGRNSGHMATYRFKVLGDMLYKRLQAASESIISSSCILTPTICANLTAKFFANSPLEAHRLWR